MLTLRSNMEAVLSKRLDKLNDLKPGGKKLNTALQTGATHVLSLSRERIHARGQDSDAGAIGAYDQKPMYVSLSAYPPPRRGGRKKRSDSFCQWQGEAVEIPARWLQ
ncbi:MAG: hypothetical protein JST90_17960 [Bacteroidetes bacterium]|nr:hypothetical protein [Bacteroidota bacterium]